ncbi:IclR family transcriptional regulator [Pseudorhizobium endolithicum]|uniref:IclR family transcriptional regulator n=1 Tax=Pseudorhizobium endolithicum TaxID=1191678 RepID=A0ABM8PU93_9HYPH|nr:IclR family transcriptional regulator [Pseudorhizobium endolithicum]CAD7048821.1 IclR family transcriptional regulator [Pseudorhizobium endolithicum]
MPTPLNNSIVRAVAILDLFDDKRQELTARDVAELEGLNGITAHRFLKTLAETGLLYSPRRGVFRLGGKLIDYGERAKSFSRLAAQVQPFLNELAATTKEGAMATTFDGSFITCIAAAHSDETFSFNARVGARMEAYATANGKLWLAMADPVMLDSYFAANSLVPLSEDTVVEEGALRKELDRIRRDGYSMNRGERETGLSAMAVPVTTRAGNMVAGMSVFGPSARFGGDRWETLLLLLQTTADKIRNVL